MNFSFDNMAVRTTSADEKKAVIEWAKSIAGEKGWKLGYCNPNSYMGFPIVAKDSYDDIITGFADDSNISCITVSFEEWYDAVYGNHDMSSFDGSQLNALL